MSSKTYLIYEVANERSLIESYPTNAEAYSRLEQLDKENSKYAFKARIIEGNSLIEKSRRGKENDD